MQKIKKIPLFPPQRIVVHFQYKFPIQFTQKSPWCFFTYRCLVFLTLQHTLVGDKVYNWYKNGWCRQRGFRWETHNCVELKQSGCGFGVQNKIHCHSRRYLWKWKATLGFQQHKTSVWSLNLKWLVYYNVVMLLRQTATINTFLVKIQLHNILTMDHNWQTYCVNALSCWIVSRLRFFFPKSKSSLI